jgi:hypothetical protein
MDLVRSAVNFTGYGMYSKSGQEVFYSLCSGRRLVEN